METKKETNKDLYRKSGLFLVIGFCISLGMVITAFEWDFPQEAVLDLRNTELRDVVDIMDVKVKELIPPVPKERPIEIVVVKKEEEATKIVPVIDNMAEPRVSTDPVSLPSEDTGTDVPVFIAEDPAAPVGGIQAFYNYVAERLRGKYPLTARKLEIEGKVFVEFIVSKSGELTDVRVVKGIGGGCDELAAEVVRTSPHWKPAKQRGKTVRQQFTIPIFFKLN